MDAVASLDLDIEVEVIENESIVEARLAYSCGEKNCLRKARFFASDGDMMWDPLDLAVCITALTSNMCTKEFGVSIERSYGVYTGDADYSYTNKLFFCDFFLSANDRSRYKGCTVSLLLYPEDDSNLHELYNFFVDAPQMNEFARSLVEMFELIDRAAYPASYPDA